MLGGTCERVLPNMKQPILEQRAAEMRAAPTRSEVVCARMLEQTMPGWWVQQAPLLGRFIADFYCYRLRLVLEVDGSGHYEPQGLEQDDRRDRALRLEGIRTLHLENTLFVDLPENPHKALRKIKAACIAQARRIGTTLPFKADAIERRMANRMAREHYALA